MGWTKGKPRSEEFKKGCAERLRKQFQDPGFQTRHSERSRKRMLALNTLRRAQKDADTTPNGKQNKLNSVPPKKQISAEPEAAQLPSRNVLIGDLAPRECKFPTSPGRPHRFCAQPAVGPKLRFCEHHQSIAIKREVKLIEEIAA